MDPSKTFEAIRFFIHEVKLCQDTFDAANQFKMKLGPYMFQSLHMQIPHWTEYRAFDSAILFYFKLHIRYFAFATNFHLISMHIFMKDLGPTIYLNPEWNY